MDLFSQVIGITEVVLLLVLLFLLIRGPFRRYFLIFAYSLAQALQTIVDGVVLRQFGQSSTEYKTVFWTDAIIVDLLLILVVIALTNQAPGQSSGKGRGNDGGKK